MVFTIRTFNRFIVVVAIYISFFPVCCWHSFNNPVERFFVAIRKHLQFDHFLLSSFSKWILVSVSTSKESISKLFSKESQHISKLATFLCVWMYVCMCTTAKCHYHFGIFFSLSLSSRTVYTQTQRTNKIARSKEINTNDRNLVPCKMRC